MRDRDPHAPHTSLPSANGFHDKVPMRGVGHIVTPDVQPIHVDAGLVKTGSLIIRDSWDGAYAR